MLPQRLVIIFYESFFLRLCSSAKIFYGQPRVFNPLLINFRYCISVHTSYSKILKEIEHCLTSTDFSTYEDFLKMLEATHTIAAIGAGRVGLVMQSFVMRLMHLGFQAHFLGDVTVPKLGNGDLLLIGSGSGATKSILNYAQIAKSEGLKLALITSNPDSAISSISDHQFILNAPNKNSPSNYLKSVQPMTTLFEQTLQIFLDSTVLDLMNLLKITSDDMWNKHNVIE